MSRYGQSRPSARRRRPPAGALLFVETLETRQMLSTTLTILPSAPASTVVPEWGRGPGGGGFGHGPGGGGGGPGGGGTGGGTTGGTTGSTGGVTNPTPPSGAYTPAEIAQAYGFSSSSDTGTGETIAIVDAYNDPNIQSDLAAFDSYYKLSTPSLTVENQAGQTTNLPATNASWDLEIAMDVEWAHAAAPGAKIELIEANSASTADLMAAVQTAAGSANVVSMSWGGGEFSTESMYDTSSYFGKAGVTFVAASGDSGGAGGAEWPASSPDVVGVGGTSLSLTSTGTYGGESAWGATGNPFTGFSGSGGGVSEYESTPSYQTGVTGTSTTGRSTPDVSSDANPNTGIAVYDSVSTSGQSGWFQVGGTSAGAPVWAGLVAAADQARAANGLASLSSTQTLSLLYGTTSSATTYASDFHDVTAGANFAGSAKTGYDLVTGLGTPVANNLIAAAATYGSTTSTATAAAATTSTKATAVATTTTTTPTVPTKTPTVTAHDVVATTTSTATTATAVATTSLALAPEAESTTAVASAGTSHATTATTAEVAPTASPVLPNQPATPGNLSTSFASIEAIAAPNVFEAVPAISPVPAAEPASAVVSAWSSGSASFATWDLACSLLVAEQHASFAGGVIPFVEPIADLADDVSLPMTVPAIVIGSVAAAWAFKTYRERDDDQRRVRPLHAWERPVFF